MPPPESCSKYSLSHFQPFFVNFKCFSGFIMILLVRNTQKYWFLFIFRRFFLISDVKSLKKPFKINKKGWNQHKKVFQPAFRCLQHPKGGQNTQHPTYSLLQLARVVCCLSNAKEGSYNSHKDAKKLFPTLQVTPLIRYNLHIPPQLLYPASLAVNVPWLHFFQNLFFSVQFWQHLGKVVAL